MTLDLYYRLGTCSRRAITKTRKKYGRPYIYRPRGDLLERLAQETGLSLWDVRQKLYEEREELLQQIARHSPELIT